MGIYIGSRKIGGSEVLYSTIGNNTDGAMTQAASTNSFVKKSGDTMTGALTIEDNDSSNLGAINIAVDNSTGDSGENLKDVRFTMNDTRIGHLRTSHYQNGNNIVSLGVCNNNDVRKGIFSLIYDAAKDYAYCPQIDGQWVFSTNTLVSSATLNAQATNTYSLSSYLPSDGHNYELLVTATGTTAASNGAIAEIGIGSDLLPTAYRVAAAQTRTTSNVVWGGTALIPVGTGRTISIQQINTTQACHINYFRIFAYRSIGLAF